MTFGVLVFPGVEELDFVGPWEMLRGWSRFLAGPERCVIVAQSLAPVVCAQQHEKAPRYLKRES